MESSTATEAPPQFEVGQEVWRYYVSTASIGDSGVFCNVESGRVVEVDGEQMVNTIYGHILPASGGWRGSVRDAATDATVRIGKIIIKLHDQIGDILERSAGK